MESHDLEEVYCLEGRRLQIQSGKRGRVVDRKLKVCLIEDLCVLGHGCCGEWVCEVTWDTRRISRKHEA